MIANKLLICGLPEGPNIRIKLLGGIFTFFASLSKPIVAFT